MCEIAAALVDELGGAGCKEECPVDALIASRSGTISRDSVGPRL